MDGKLFNNKVSDLFVELIFDQIKNKLPWYLKKIAKVLLGIAMGFVNKYGDKVIPDSIDPYLNEAAEKFKVGEIDAAVAALTNAENILVDIPELNETEEYSLLYGNTYTLIVNLKALIEKRKKQ